MYLRRNFSSSGLVRLLGDWMPVDAEAPRQDVAERLGQWLSVPDVITLHAAHQTIGTVQVASPPGPGLAAAGEARDELLRVRASLEQAITARDGAAAPVTGTGYARYHQRYLDRQRRMATSVDALRDRVRQALAGASPRLAQLAALDAVLDRMFGAREHRLLYSVPLFLRERFEQLRQRHPDDADAVATPGAWEEAFEQEFRQALRDELELRLQPVAGMIEALGNEAKQQQ